MREIKFRGRRLDNFEWVYGYYYFIHVITEKGVINQAIICFTNEHGNFVEYAVDPETVGQYTGLKDNTKWDELTKVEQKEWIDKGENKETWNGKEIYEGDIVEYYDSLYLVKWGEHSTNSGEYTGYLGFYIDKGNGFYEENIRVKGTDYKIIGNIYENPDIINRRKI